MGRRATFSEAQIARAVKGARRADPKAIVEVTPGGVIRILPESAPPVAADDDVEKWFRDPS